MLYRFSLVLFVFASFHSIASIPEVEKEYSCSDLDEVKLRLNVASQNYQNAITTRTPDGTPYRKKIVSSCKRGKCSIVSLNRFKKVHNPRHPDADTTGHVYFPEINKREELYIINKNVAKLRELAKLNTCQIKLFVHKKNRNVFMIQYPEDEMSDRFVVKNNSVESWTVKSPMGKDTIRFN